MTQKKAPTRGAVVSGNVISMGPQTVESREEVVAAMRACEAVARALEAWASKARVEVNLSGSTGISL